MAVTVKSGLGGGKTETTYYLDKALEKVVSATNGVVNKTEFKHYIGDVAIQTNTLVGSTSDWSLSYIHRDRLGSVVTVTDHNAVIKEHRSYDPFGKPRRGDFVDASEFTLLASIQDDPHLGTSLATDRGFTDHEHLDDAQLIHMNGRVYDYNLGRFLSVDPFVQAPGNSQSMNPYSYIMNNPLSGTDPSGYKSCHEGELKDCSIKIGETVKVKNEDGKTTKTVTSNKDGSFTVNVATNNGKQIDSYSIAKQGAKAEKISSIETKDASSSLTKFADRSNANREGNPHNIEGNTYSFGSTQSDGTRRVDDGGTDPDANRVDPQVANLYSLYTINFGISPGALGFGGSNVTVSQQAGIRGASTSANATKLLPPPSAANMFKQMGSFKNMKIPEIMKVLKTNGFRFAGRTNGGYIKFYGQGTKSTRTEVWIRPNGQVVRLEKFGKGNTRRFDANGSVTQNHKGGEIIRGNFSGQ